MRDGAPAVAQHYALEDLSDHVLDALRRAGVDVGAPTPDDLAPLDEFHIRGREATEELAELAELAEGQQILDVGCGLGGTARYLAARHGVRVTGVDLTPEYCRVGNMLTGLTGPADRVELTTADAVALPFADGSFDVVWTEHAAMNIADKRRLYGELRRVLRPQVGSGRSRRELAVADDPRSGGGGNRIRATYRSDDMLSTCRRHR